MYKYKSGQISITDFGQPMGMHLNENNRWVKKAAMIPWNEIEKRYAGLFKSHKGHPAKPLRLLQCHNIIFIDLKCFQNTCFHKNIPLFPSLS